MLIISHVGFGIYLIEKKNGYIISKYIYTIIVFYLAYFSLVGTSPHDIAEKSSGNIVNYIVLSFSILIIGLYYRNYNKVIVFPAIFSLLISFWTLGRSGIIVSIILILGVLIIKYMRNLNKFTFSLMLLATSFFGYSVYKFMLKLSQSIIYKFGERSSFIEESPRSEIIKAYFSELNTRKVLFGLDYYEFYFAGFNNLHNSFLDFHSKFGLGGMLVIGIVFIILIFFLLTKQFLYFILLTCLLLRGATDTVMLVGDYDYILLFLILVCVEDLMKKNHRIMPVEKFEYYKGKWVKNSNNGIGWLNAKK
ncbi:hypothetical protein GCM10008983_09220 [Lentibacillus halophilus]|uniref:O-Antigen ligase n=2 Tax=Lentibacillus halophilus TaxID=295065 RepID=A0ABN0Z619_9BACI